jgi:Iron only hydrogenase large subunit, C-terminal domain
MTSCCPGWVNFVEQNYPELIDNLSTAKSPQQMMGAVIKNYFDKKTQ